MYLLLLSFTYIHVVLTHLSCYCNISIPSVVCSPKITEVSLYHSELLIMLFTLAVFLLFTSINLYSHL